MHISSIARPLALSRHVVRIFHPRTSTASFRGSQRGFGSTPCQRAARVFQSVRSPAELDTLLLMTASSRTELITLWTASWCRSCRTVLPVVKQAIEECEHENLGFVEVEFDTPGNEELGSRYMITSIPTLLAFSRQEAQMLTRVTDAKKLTDRNFLAEWLQVEAARGGDGGAGGQGWLGKVVDTFKGKP